MVSIFFFTLFSSKFQVLQHEYLLAFVKQNNAENTTESLKKKTLMKGSLFIKGACFDYRLNQSTTLINL
jgi:hypothetical protein